MGSSVVLAKDLHACVSIRCSVGSTPAHINIELRMHTPLSLPLIEQRAAAAAAAAQCCTAVPNGSAGSYILFWRPCPIHIYFPRSFHHGVQDRTDDPALRQECSGTSHQ
jgi:hypothetical protein